MTYTFLKDSFRLVLLIFLLMLFVLGQNYGAGVSMVNSAPHLKKADLSYNFNVNDNTPEDFSGNGNDGDCTSGGFTCPIFFLQTCPTGGGGCYRHTNAGMLRDGFDSGEDTLFDYGSGATDGLILHMDIQFHDTSATTALLLNKQSSYEMSIISDKDLRCRVHGTVVTTAETDNSAGDPDLSDGSPYDLICMLDGVNDTLTAWIDGVQYASAARTDTLAQVSGTLTVGFDDTNFRYDGFIDNVWVLGESLSINEIALLVDFDVH